MCSKENSLSILKKVCSLEILGEYLSYFFIALSIGSLSFPRLHKRLLFFSIACFFMLPKI